MTICHLSFANSKGNFWIFLTNQRKIMYKTELIKYTPVAKTMAKKIEDKCNEMEKEGFVLVSTTITLGAKAILVFKK